MHAELLESCPTLCDPMGCSPPGSPSMGFSRQEYWSKLPCPPPGDLPDPGMKPTSLISPALAMGSLPRVPPGLTSPVQKHDNRHNIFNILRLSHKVKGAYFKRIRRNWYYPESLIATEKVVYQYLIMIRPQHNPSTEAIA